MRGMAKEAIFEEAQKAIVENDAKRAKKLAERGLDEGIDPMELLNEGFIKGINKMGADIIGSSALLTTTMDVQKRLEGALRKAGLKEKYKTIVGGAPATQRWADRIGADAYAEDAADGIRKAKRLLEKG
jgi:methanogenic corrinoid protein MtbC1